MEMGPPAAKIGDGTCEHLHMIRALSWTIKAKNKKTTQISKAAQYAYKWDPNIYIGFCLKHKLGSHTQWDFKATKTFK